MTAMADGIFRGEHSMNCARAHDAEGVKVKNAQIPYQMIEAYSLVPAVRRTASMSHWDGSREVRSRLSFVHRFIDVRLFPSFGYAITQTFSPSTTRIQVPSPRQSM
jgi:hypothetical protein